MKKVHLIYIAYLYLSTASSLAVATESIAQSITTSGKNHSSQSVNNYTPTKQEQIIVLYDNPMEEYTVISVLITQGYNIKVENQLNAAIEESKKQAASLGAHAIIILPPDYNKDIASVAETKILSVKAIRYKHFYQ